MRINTARKIIRAVTLVAGLLVCIVIGILRGMGRAQDLYYGIIVAMILVDVMIEKIVRIVKGEPVKQALTTRYHDNSEDADSEVYINGQWTKRP